MAARGSFAFASLAFLGGGDRGRRAVDVTNSTCEGASASTSTSSNRTRSQRTKYFLFRGGCVTYRYRFGPQAEATLALEAEGAVTFGLRTVLVAKVQEELGLTLSGAGAPPCADGG
jgi:hypothetical protein